MKIFLEIKQTKAMSDLTNHNLFKTRPYIVLGLKPQLYKKCVTEFPVHPFISKEFQA